MTSLPPTLWWAISVVVIVIQAVGMLWLMRPSCAKGSRMAFLGSGGHTGEMLSLVKSLNPEKWIFVVGQDDALSLKRIQTFDAQTEVIYRARHVGQGWASSCVSSIHALLGSMQVIWKHRPEYLLVNGPGTSIMLILAAVCLTKTRVVYVESLARVHRLSLSGRIVYRLGLASIFIVQWPELAKAYPGTIYRGLLV